MNKPTQALQIATKKQPKLENKENFKNWCEKNI